MPLNGRHDEYAQLLRKAGAATINGQHQDAEKLIQNNWPHLPKERTKRTASEKKKLTAWLKDGFRCRYCGDLLMFPAYMTALSKNLSSTPKWQG